MATTNRKLLGEKLNNHSKATEIEDDVWKHVDSLQKHVDAWSGKHISRWLEGLGDSMNPFLGTIRDNLRSGKHLGLVDNDTLLQIGISGLGARKTILQAIQLLDYFCHEAPHENLQSLAMKVTVACNAVSREMLNAIRQREKANRRAEIVSILNNISSAVSNLAEHVKRLVFWLDRSPFDGIDQYVEWRNQISTLIWSLVKNVNVQPKTLFSVSADIIQNASDLKEVCEYIVRENDEPAVLYTSNTEPALIKRGEPGSDWGINVQSSYRGVHVISEIKEGSPADICGQIDAGDEIMLINGKTVIGWDLTRVAQRLGSTADRELRLVVNKRPRDNVPILVKNAVKTMKTTAKPLAKMAPGSQSTYTTDGDKGFGQENGYPLNRRRSTTFAIKMIRELRKGKNTTRKRRASISCNRESTGPAEREPPQHVQWDLLELLGLPSESDNETRVVRRARTMRHQPDGYVRSFIDNKIVQEIDDDVISDQLPFNVVCPTEFAKITIVEPAELTQYNINEPKTTDCEWSAPVTDVAVQRFRAPAGDSNLSGLSLDSPRRMMLSSLEEAFPAFGVLPSPSSSSIHSVSSPAPNKLMALSAIDWGTGSGDDIPLTPMTPSLFSTGEKIFEGWARRRKTGTELSENTNKWPKCWMCLKGPYLSIYPNQYAKRADITINVSKCMVTDVIDIKTSKKFVFRLSRPSVDYHFSCYNQQDMRSWIHKIGMAGDLYGNPGRTMSKSLSYFKEGSGDDMPSTGHYNTMTGLPSLMSQSNYECSSPSALAASPGPGSNSSLPRSGLLSTLNTHKPQLTGSQTSVKSKK